MHVVVLGIGMIGTTVVRELVDSSVIKKITAVDAVHHNIEECKSIANSSKVTGKITSLGTEELIYDVLKDADIAISCLPHSLSIAANKAAIKAGCNLVDLAGSKFEEKLNFDKQAKEAGVIIMPGCGVAPGITNVLAARGIDLLDEAKEAIMMCGGIPRYPIPPLNYQVVFRLESLLDLYTRPALAVENGKVIELPPLSGLEKVIFPSPVGECEIVVTDAHSAAYTLKDKVDYLYEKTVRYTGHWEKMGMLAELGFLSEKETKVEGNKLKPRDFTKTILEPSLKGKSIEDITVLRVECKGLKKGIETVYEWEMVDFYDHERKITSMAKTTAMPAIILAEWIAQGKIKEKGVLAIESVIVGDLFEPFIEDLNNKGVEITFKSK